jgi:hypothetical protein
VDGFMAVSGETGVSLQELTLPGSRVNAIGGIPGTDPLFIFQCP